LKNIDERRIGQRTSSEGKMKRLIDEGSGIALRKPSRHAIDCLCQKALSMFAHKKPA